MSIASIDLSVLNSTNVENSSTMFELYIRAKNYIPTLLSKHRDNPQSFMKKF